MRISDWSADVCSSNLGVTVDDVRAIDVAPTIAFLLGIDGPQNARGRILYAALTDTAALREITILAISAYPGQDRKRVGEGKMGSVRADLGGGRNLNKKNQTRMSTHNKKQPQTT